MPDMLAVIQRLFRPSLCGGLLSRHATLTRWCSIRSGALERPRCGAATWPPRHHYRQSQAVHGRSSRAVVQCAGSLRSSRHIATGGTSSRLNSVRRVLRPRRCRHHAPVTAPKLRYLAKAALISTGSTMLGGRGHEEHGDVASEWINGHEHGDLDHAGRHVHLFSMADLNRFLRLQWRPTSDDRSRCVLSGRCRPRDRRMVRWLVTPTAIISRATETVAVAKILASVRKSARLRVRQPPRGRPGHVRPLAKKAAATRKRRSAHG